jgi:hypothetical protein
MCSHPLVPYFTGFIFTITGHEILKLKNMDVNECYV